MRLSIIVLNYNYARFLRTAIDSALSVIWPEAEVIVVDDGSTDKACQKIISSYGGRVVPVFKENGGQNSAANAGFRHSTGDVIVFLDADDAIHDPDIGERLIAGFKPRVAKWQWPMIQVDEKMERLGPVWPQYTDRDTPARVVYEIRNTGSYLTPPTSGNAWSRWFLEEVFPLPVRPKGETGRWGLFFDDYLHMIAPRRGDVVSLSDPMTYYRLHAKMNSHFGGHRPPQMIADVCDEETSRMKAVNAFLASKNIPFRYDFEKYDGHLRGRLVYVRAFPERYPYGDSRFSLVGKYTISIMRTERNAIMKLAHAGWAAVTAFAPKKIGIRVGLMTQ